MLTYLQDRIDFSGILFVTGASDSLLDQLLVSSKQKKKKEEVQMRNNIKLVPLMQSLNIGSIFGQ